MRKVGNCDTARRVQQSKIEHKSNLSRLWFVCTDHSLLTYTLLAATDSDLPGPLEGKTLEGSESTSVADINEWFNFATSQSSTSAGRVSLAAPNVQTTMQAKGFAILQLAK